MDDRIIFGIVEVSIGGSTAGTLAEESDLPGVTAVGCNVAFNPFDGGADVEKTRILEAVGKTRGSGVAEYVETVAGSDVLVDEGVLRTFGRSLT